MTATLRYSPDLALPLDAVTQRFSFLGRIGSGKTYGATKLAELMLDAGAQVVALDPVGLWYGLRVAGKGGGYSLPVFGGLHGDVPLESGAGAIIADLIVDRGLSCVLDVSQFESDADKSRFAAAFAKRFFFRKKAAPSAVHVFLEECQEFIPQNPQPKETDMLHEWTRMAKLGRNFGIGLSLISQRPQEVNKKVLNLTECLVAFQMTGAHERKAIREWIASVGADENILTVLPSLPVGVAHIYSPQWLRISKQIKAAPKRSADVSSTPQVGASPVEARPLTKVDLAALRDVMAATIEKAKADDPKELRKRIVELERAAGKAPTGWVSHEAMTSQINAAVAAATKSATLALTRTVNIMLSTATSLQEEGERAKQVCDHSADSRAVVPVGNESNRTGANHPADSAVGRSSRAPAKPIATPLPRAVRAAPVEGITTGQQKILNALAELWAIGIEEPRRTQLALFASMSLNGGSGAQNIADLVQTGLVEIPDKGVVRLTEAGMQAASDVGVPSSSAELHARVMAKLSTGQQKILCYLLDVYPTTITRASMAESIGMSLNGGSGAQNIADLVSLGAVRIPNKGKVMASELMFPAGLR